MKRYVLIWTLISLAGVIVSLALLIELRAHDPYHWLDFANASVESRDRWNERKSLYFYWLAGSLVSLLISGGALAYRKLTKPAPAPR